MKQSRLPELEPKRKKAITRAAAAAVAAITNNHSEMFALKHYKAFQFIQIKWDCFYFSCRLPKNKRNYYWILCCLLIYFCIRFFFIFLLLLCASLYLDIAKSFCCQTWSVAACACVWFQSNTMDFAVCVSVYVLIMFAQCFVGSKQPKYMYSYIYWMFQLKQRIFDVFVFLNPVLILKLFKYNYFFWSISAVIIFHTFIYLSVPFLVEKTHIFDILSLFYIFMQVH